MDDGAAWKEACRPRRLSSSAHIGANLSPQDGEMVHGPAGREMHPAAGRRGSEPGRVERRNSATQAVHQRHMPMEPKKFHIPRKTKEQKALFQYVSTESREYEDMMTILTSSYIDANSAGSFIYSKPRLVHSELLEKEFVEKRKEMKGEGRTEKELEESYCFLMTNSDELPFLCEKGLTVGHSRIICLGNPNKGVYLSKYSDLLQMSSFNPGSTGEIIIFKVMKGKIKSIYENVKNLLDPTPRFDTHIAKNASKITSLTCYRAFELTQQYFYEYSFDELRQRPRQLCPFAVVSFQFKGKDVPLPTKPAAPISRSNSQSANGDKQPLKFTVWSGDLVYNDKVLLQISLQSNSSPFLPLRPSEKLQIGCLMRIDQLTRMLPPSLLSYNFYSGSQEVVCDEFYSSLLEVTAKTQSEVRMALLLQELEAKKVVLVVPLSDRGFLLLLSSVQMATPAEREENWRRCLHALFVFPESRDVAKFTSHQTTSPHDSSWSSPPIMPRFNMFIPALHHALIKARANPPSSLSVGVEHQTREYLSGLKDGSVQQYSVPEYNSKQDKKGKIAPPLKHHRSNMDSYLRSYFCGPAQYQLPVTQAKKMVELYCRPEPVQDPRIKNSCESTGRRAVGSNNDQKMQQLLDLVVVCKRVAENEMRRERLEGIRAPEKKRKMEKEVAERALKYFKASQESGGIMRTPVFGNRAFSAPFSFASVMGSLGLRGEDVKEDSSEITTKLYGHLKGLIRDANQNIHETHEETQKEPNPFSRLATKLGLPTNCDIDLRRQEDLEEQTAGSVSSLEGFSPGSHSGDINHHGDGARGLQRTADFMGVHNEQSQIPWILHPITGLTSQRYSQSDKNIPLDPRFQHLTTTTSITADTTPPRNSPASSPVRTPPPSPFMYPPSEVIRPPLSSDYPSPIPSPPNSPSQCPSPVPSPPTSPSQCPSPQPSPYPSPEPSPPSSPLAYVSPESEAPTSPDQSAPPESSYTPPSGITYPPPTSERLSQSLELNDFPQSNQHHSCANEQPLAPPALSQVPGVWSENDAEPEDGESAMEERAFTALKMPNDPRAAAVTNICTGLFINHARDGEETDTNGGLEANMDVALHDEAHLDQDWSRVKRTEQEDVNETDQLGEFTRTSPLVSSSSGAAAPAAALHTDKVVDKHLGDFSTEIQLLLQKESIHYTCKRSTSPLLRTDTPTSPSSLPYTVMPQFSQYVSFYNPSPPVHNYVASLQNSIIGMLADFDICVGQQSDPAQGHKDTSLANTVSSFVASVRATNTPTMEDSDAPFVCSGHPADRGHSTELYTDVRWEPPSASWIPPHTITSPQSVHEPVSSTQDSEQIQPNSLVRTGSPVDVKGMTSEPGDESSFEAASATTDLSSVISQLEPDMLNNLVEIIKEIKKRTPHFYIHSTDPGDPDYAEVKEHLIKLGHLERNPVDFLNQDNTDGGLLIIIKNKDIPGHLHKIPGLMSLKRHPSVIFMGIDSSDDLRCNRCTELFVSGGCIVSDELVLNPDIICHDRLCALLELLHHNNSPESVWRWKIHWKTQKRLKEQARFRRDAASLLDVLTTYQERKIVEFLPCHPCDSTNTQSPDLDCLVKLQAGHTQFRHTIFLTELHFDKFPLYSNVGIIVASIAETLQNFSKLVGCQNIKDKRLVLEDLLSPKGALQEQSQFDPSHLSTIPEQIQLLCASNKLPQVFPLSASPAPSSAAGAASSALEVMSPGTSRDMEFLQQAIRQLRAERQQQLEQLRLQKQQLEPQNPSPASQNTTPQEQPPPTNSIPSESVHSPPSLPKNQELRQSHPGSGGADPPGDETTKFSEAPDPSRCQDSAGGEPSVQQESGTQEKEKHGEPHQSPIRPTKGDTSREQASPHTEVTSGAAKVSPRSKEAVERVKAAGAGTAPPTPGSRQSSSQAHKGQAHLNHRTHYGVNFVQNPHLGAIHTQHYPPRPILGPLTNMRSVSGILGPLASPQLWAGAYRGPMTPYAWGVPYSGLEYLRYYHAAEQGSSMYRRGRRGGGFNGI